VLRQAVALQGKDALLVEHHGLVKHRSVIEAEYHAALDCSATADDLKQIARRNERSVDSAQ